MRSPLDVVAGEFDHAVLTTFTIDLTFIDQWVLPRLINAGVRNLVILADGGPLAEQLALGAATRAGRDYHLATIECAGVFHAKVMYLNGPNERRVCVSSANLTPAGQLRNYETAAALSSHDSRHAAAIADVEAFLRRLADPLPAHVHEALLTALAAATPVATEDTVPRFLHNLDRPIAEQLPLGPTNATAPFVSHTAIDRLHLTNPLRLTIDRARTEAVHEASVTTSPLQVVAFGTDSEANRHRTVHGKAYWHPDSAWCVVGSPNLTGAALYETAATGNVEAALLLRGEDAQEFALPPIEPVAAAELDSILEEPRRRQPADTAIKISLFQARFDGDLVIDGLPDGSVIDTAGDLGWLRYGVVEQGRLAVSTELGVPNRLRSQAANGTFLYAIVHYVPWLRARRKTRLSRAAAVLETPPLDLQGVHQLESVLGALYVLDELAEQESNKRAAADPSSVAPDRRSERLTDWLPARPHEDPRVPDLYRTVFDSDPDALLVMIRNALRLAPETPDEPSPVEDNEELPEEDADREGATRQKQLPRTSADVIRRYRGSLLKLIDRGAQRLGPTVSGALRDLTFLELFNLHEKLSSTSVLIPHADARRLGVLKPPDDDGNVEVRLLERDHLIEGRLTIIAAFLASTSEVDPLCVETLRAHLAAAVLDRDKLSDRRRKELDAVCYKHAATLLTTKSSNLPLLDWLTPSHADALLAEYAERTDWSSVADHCGFEGWLEDADITLEPHPVLRGEGRFSNSFDSPAWRVLGYACVAGYEGRTPFGVIVAHPDTTSAFAFHCLRIAPSGSTQRGDDIEEALLRRKDGRWITAQYHGFRRRQADGLLHPVKLRQVLDSLQRQDCGAVAEAPAFLRMYQTRS